MSVDKKIIGWMIRKLLVKPHVWNVVLYSCETCTIGKEDKRDQHLFSSGVTEGWYRLAGGTKLQTRKFSRK